MQVHGVLIMALLEMLYLVLIILHHLMLKIARIVLLVLGATSNFRINGSFALPEKKYGINSSKVKEKFCLSLHCIMMLIINIRLLMEKKCLCLKQIPIFQLSFVSEAYLMDLVLPNKCYSITILLINLTY